MASDQRRHLTELNQEKIYSAAGSGREKRLSSVERENKLLSPEKVLSLRRNSAAGTTAGDQPLSSLLNVDAEVANGVIGRSTSKTSRDFATSNRYESFESSRSNHVTKHSEYNEQSSRRVDNASNVKGKSVS